MGGLFVLFLLAESGSGKSTLIKLLISNLNQGTEPYFLNINLVAVDISHTPVYVIQTSPCTYSLEILPNFLISLNALNSCLLILLCMKLLFKVYPPERSSSWMIFLSKIITENNRKKQSS